MEGVIMTSGLKEETQPTATTHIILDDDPKTDLEIESRLSDIIKDILETHSYISATEDIVALVNNKACFDMVLTGLQRIFVKIMRGPTKTNEIEETLCRVSLPLI
jgi:hypothetical protein